MTGSPNLETVSTRLQRIAHLAREDPKRAFLSLAHHIDLDFLREAYRRTRKDGAPGVDGQTAAAYEENLEANLQDLLGRFKSGRYQAPPVRRAYVPKGSDPSKKRPIGIPTFEDKVLQRAVAMVLEAVYEQDFLDCSYAFRPERSAHQAIRKLWEGLMAMGGGWVLEADIQSFYDDLDRSQLRSFLDQRVRDGVIRRALDKWLKAGVMEGGTLSHPTTGTPQGGVISPLLSNIYLHEVLDTWFEAVVKPRLQGAAFLIRFADDFVLVFQLESDARRMLEVLPKRFGKYGLSLHPDKTRLVRFERPGPADGSGRTQPHEHGGVEIRLSRLHPLLGKVSAGPLDGQAQDGFGPDYPVLAANQRVASRQPACTPRLAACTTSQQAARAQRVLRDHRELAVSEQRAPKGQADLAQVAQSPLAKAQHALEAVSTSLEAVPATEPENLCCGLKSRSEPGT